MVYTCRTVSARQLLAFGTVLDVVPPGELRDAAQALAEEIAAKGPAVIRLAKQSLNGIDPVDVKRSYRYEQGFTFELNLAGAGTGPGRPLSTGSTWTRSTWTRSTWTGSRRDAGRDRRGAAGRDDDRDRRVGIAAQADGPGPGDPALAAHGPHDRVLRGSRRRAAGRVRAGQAGGHRVRVAGLDPLEPNFRRARPGRHDRADRAGRGHAALGLLAAAHRLPFLPIRAGLGSGVLEVNPELRTVRSPYADNEELVAMPALAAGRRAGAHEPGRRRGQRPVPRPDPYFATCSAWRRSGRTSRGADRAAPGGPAADPAA